MFNIFSSFDKPDASAQVFEIVEQLIRTADELAGIDGIQIVADVLLSSGVFQEFLLGLRESYEAHHTTGPKARVSSMQGQVETDY